MTRTINVKVNDEMYYDLVMIKAKLHFDTWIQLFEYIVKHEYNEQTKQLGQTQDTLLAQTEQPEQLKSTKQSTQREQPLCQCGHPDRYHSSDGCLGDGGVCECKQFTEAN